MTDGTIVSKNTFFSPGTLDPNTFRHNRDSKHGPAPDAAPGFPIRFTTGLFVAATGGQTKMPITTGYPLFPEPGHVVASPFGNGRKGAIGNG